MATLSTFQKFKEEQEKRNQGGQQSTQQSSQQSGQKSTGLLNSYQQFMAKQQGQETTYTPESDYGQRVMTAELAVGDVVTMQGGAPVYGMEREFQSWVYSKQLYVRAIVGDRITISIFRTGAVTGNVHRKYLTKV